MEETKVASISCRIIKNLTFLNENLSNLSKVLTRLLQNGIITNYEREEIKNSYRYPTDFDKNDRLHEIILRKGNADLLKYLEILKETNNTLLAATVLEEPLNEPTVVEDTIQIPIYSRSHGNWWPSKKKLVKSFFKRKVGAKYLVEELQEKLKEDVNRMVVISQTPDALKLSGLGGVGKTAMAVWYAEEYHENYNGIIWIDCGEDSLAESFKRLSTKLGIQEINTKSLEDLAQECFSRLENWLCLWIFDNAECYLGEKGIQNFLPWNISNFDTLITSRDVQWGSENGLGKLTEFRVDIFTMEDSIDFLKNNLDSKISRDENDLKKLCTLLGNLPLALQLAVTSLNSGSNLNLKEYIKSTSSFENIIDESFDDYEKTIAKNCQISLNSLKQKNQKHGELACKVFSVLGYVRPDNVDSEFLKRVTKSESKDLNKALDLLEKYCMIAINSEKLRREEIYYPSRVTRFFNFTDIKFTEVETTVISIHRLLQQVIRLIGANTEEKTLKDIFYCPEFLDYKFIPFTMYASDKLQKEFPDLKAQLVDQIRLEKLLKGKMYAEAVETAGFIHKQINSDTSHYNYAHCLRLAGRTTEALAVLQVLYAKLEIHKTDIIDNGISLVRLSSAIDRGAVICQLFLIYGEQREIDNATRMLNELWMQLVKLLDFPLKSLPFFIGLLESIFKKQCYSVKFWGLKNVPSFKMNFGKAKSIEINYVYGNIIWRSIFECLPNDLQTLKLNECSPPTLLKFSRLSALLFKGWFMQPEIIVIGSNIRILSIDNSKIWGPFQIEFKLETGKEQSCSIKDKIILDNTLVHSFKGKLYAKEIHLTYLSHLLLFQSSPIINSFIDFKFLKILKLICVEFPLSLSGSASLDSLELSEMKILDWENSKWKVGQLILIGIPFVQKTTMEIQELIVRSAKVDESCLSETMERVTNRGGDKDLMYRSKTTTTATVE